MFPDHDIRPETTKEAMMERCPDCGGADLTARSLEKYHYRESGLDNVWLHGGGVIEFTCGSCGRKSIAVHKESQLLQVIAMSLLMRPGRLRGPELRYLRHACDLTQEQLAHKLDVLRAAVIRWERGAVERLDRARVLHLRMVLLKEFQQALSEPENDHLEDWHRKQLAEFAGRFTEEFERVFTRRARVTVVVRNRDDAWEPPSAAA